MALLLAVMLTVTIVMNYFSQTMDAYLGRGARSVTNVEGAEDWDTDYYEQKYETSPEARDAAAKVAAKISDNGIVLLKNDGCLPLAKTTRVTPMGYRYLDPIYGGSGSGNVNSTEDYVVTPEEGVAAVFGDINNAVVTAMKEAEDELEAANPVNGADGGSDNYSGARTSVPEYPEAIYEGVANTMKDTVGLVYIGRVGGEGGDLCATEYDDGTVHELALTARERALLELAKKNCSEVIVILDTSNAMQVPELEDDEKIGAILEIGGPGCSGFGSLGRILVGDVNPSGRLVDTWAADFTKDPVYVNFDKSITNNVSDGIMNYTNAIHTYQTPDGVTVNYNIPFREYEEGVYMGYRYYETAASLGYFTSDDLPDGVTDPYYNRENGVVYPFGFGLSYTTFTQEITDMDVSEADNRLTVTVEVVNTGDKDGRDTVQLYYSAPYTDFDVTNMIEKPSVVLGEYAKTGVLKADGGKETVTIELALDEMASYCFTRKNGDGTTGAYVLEGGKYGVSIRSDSHTVLDSDEFEISETVWYDNDNIRPSEIAAQSALDAKGEPLGYPAAGPDAEFTAATNKYEKSNAYMTDDSISEATILSRSNWEATQPTGATDADRMASEEVVEWMEWNAGAFDYETDEVLGNVSGSLAYKADKPVSGADNKLTLADMRGLDYYDDNWDILLDQLDYTDELKLALFMGGYTTGEVTTIGKPLTVDRDGPQGLTQSSNDGSSWLGNVCAYPSEVVLAQTWDRDLAYEYGYSVGQEALTNGTNGWYAPGVNMHRSQFGGRNFEYYSEDATLSGYMAANVVKGAAEKGLICYMKHFALNDMETARENNDMSVWADEQATRQIYLRPFERAAHAANSVKTTATTVTPAGFMTSFNRFGFEWAGACYDLMTGLVRDEWGIVCQFQTDAFQSKNGGMNANMMIRAGGDIGLDLRVQDPLDFATIFGQPKNGTPFLKEDQCTPSHLQAIFDCVKRQAYCLLNSNATMNGYAFDFIYSEDEATQNRGYNLSEYDVTGTTVTAMKGIPMTLNVSDSDLTDVQYRMQLGEMPEGLTLDPETGIISGAVDASVKSGEYTVKICATAEGATDDDKWVIFKNANNAITSFTIKVVEPSAFDLADMILDIVTKVEEGEDVTTDIATLKAAIAAVSAASGDMSVEAIKDRLDALEEALDALGGAAGPAGPQGPAGEDGQDGQTPVIEIGANGNWFINGVDTGVAATGPAGGCGGSVAGTAVIVAIALAAIVVTGVLVKKSRKD